MIRLYVSICAYILGSLFLHLCASDTFLIRPVPNSDKILDKIAAAAWCVCLWVGVFRLCDEDDDRNTTMVSVRKSKETEF